VRLYSILDPILRPLAMRVYRVDLRGAHRIPPTGPVILAANHESILDGLFLALSTRRQVRFMAKVELYRVPILKQLLEGVGAFPVDRQADEGRAVLRGVELLEQGEVVGIFPQGTCLPYRSRPFKRGAARLALAAGAPIVPVALVHTERALRPGKVRVGFPRVPILIGEPIPVERRESTPDDEVALTTQLEQAVQELRAPFGPPEHVWIDD
jgi:1-acyl-sn-glycerol-3-phosphate acyltransferase